MQFQTFYIEDLDVHLEFSTFSAGRVGEFHVMMHVEPKGKTFQEQIHALLQAQETIKKCTELSEASPVFKRYFLSDATNQASLINDPDTCTISYIQQPPLDGSKVAVWIYMQRGTDIEHVNESTVVTHNGYRHIWTMGLMDSTVETSYMQTWQVMLRYIDTLKLYNATLEANCIRTWFFVRDVDTQYAGLVKSRRECFLEQGLTPSTHYISSTGIGGNPADPKAIVQMGCYAITGFQSEQQQYLYALSHLNKTIEYGVTFERGTLFRYGDRNHIYISGTASIDNKGKVLHVGNIVQQTKRMWENVETLLAEGGMNFSNVMHIIVYLRDNADYNTVKAMFEVKFPNTPYIITLAPVCRPSWLIEMECIAVAQACNKEFKEF